MNKELLLGIILGFASSFLGTFLYVALFTNFNLIRDFALLDQNGLLGKVITLGTLLTVLTFLFFFYKKRDSIAKGIVIAVVLLMLFTFFV